MSDLENDKGYVRRIDGVHLAITPADQPVAIYHNGLISTEIFIDLTNIENSLKKFGRFETNYGEFLQEVIHRFADRLGLKAATISNTLCGNGDTVVQGQPVAFCRGVWCFTSRPVNYHPDDSNRIKSRQRFITALRRQHSFIVEEVPLNFHGRRIGHKNGSDNQLWYPKEKGVDVLLAIRLLRRSLSPNRPRAVILMSGDADYAPALAEILRQEPPVLVMVAAFSDSLSEVYCSGNPFGYSWQFPPLLLDKCLRDLYSKQENPPVKSSYSGIVAAV